MRVDTFPNVNSLGDWVNDIVVLKYHNFPFDWYIPDVCVCACVIDPVSVSVFKFQPADSDTLDV